MNRGEIWLVNFAPAVAAEIQKTRPAIVMSLNNVGKLPLKIVVPVTDWKTEYGELMWMTAVMPSEENGIVKKSAADAFQVKSLSQKRFVKKIGTLESSILSEITEKITLCIGYKS
jgi:mRNA interferase MazF